MAEEPTRPVTIVSLLWRGNPVEVSGDQGLLRRSGTRHIDPIGVIATAIGAAGSFAEIQPSLQASTVGETHDVEVGIKDGRIEIRLSAR